MNELQKLRIRLRWRKRATNVFYLVAIGVCCWLTIAVHNDRFVSLGQAVRRFTSSDSIHIVTASDESFFQGLPTLFNSIRMSSKYPPSIVVHVIVCGGDNVIQSMREFLACYGFGGSGDIQINIVKFQLRDIVGEEMMYAWKDMFSAKRLTSDCNFARSYMYRIFPDVKRVIYLDADIAVKEPIENLWRIANNFHAPLLAVEVNRTYEADGFVTDAVSKLYLDRYGRQFDPTATVFNGGVLVMDLDFYRKYNLIDEVEYWVKAFSDAPARLWRFDCQSVFQIVYHELWGKLNQKWNSRGLGRKRERPAELIESAGILHWSAADKPWTGIGPHVALWEQFRPAECSNHGICDHNPNATQTGYWQCVCQSQYAGVRCQKHL